MKKLILTLSIIISVVGLLITASPLILRLTGLDRPAKAYLIGLAFPDKDVEANIENFRIGLGTLELNDLDVVSADKRFRLHIPLVQFSFYFHDFFLHPGEPQLALKSIAFIRPRLVITETGKRQTRSVKTSADETDFSSFFHTLNTIKNIRSVEIENGILVFHTAQGDSFDLAKNVVGQLTAADSNRFYLTVNGCALAKEDTNFMLKTTFNLLKKQAVAELDILNYRIDQAEVPFSVPEVEVKDGVLDGKLRFITTNLKPDSTFLHGRIALKDLQIQTKNRQWDKLNATLKIDQKTIDISDGTALLESYPLHFSVHSTNGLTGRLTAELTAKDFSTGVITGNDSTKDVKDIKLHISAALPDTSFRARLTSKKIFLSKENALDSIAVNVHYKNGVFTLPAAFARYDKRIRLQAQGGWDVPNDLLWVQAGLKGRTNKHIVFDKFSNKTEKAQLTARMNTITGQISGKWDFGLTGKTDTTAWFAGNIRGSANELQFTLMDCSAPATKAQLRIQNLFSNPVIRQAALVNFPLDAFTSDGLLVGFLKKVQTEIQLHGSPEDLMAKLTVTDKHNVENRFHLNGRIQNLFGDTKKINGIIELKKMLGFYSATLQDTRLLAQVKFPAGLSGKVNLDIKEDGPLRGEMHLSDFNIYSLLSDTLQANDLRLESRLNGNLSVNGTIRNPLLNAHLTGDRFIFNNIGYYRGDVDLHLNKEALNVDSLTVSVNNVPIMDGNLRVRFADQRLFGNITGNQVDVYNLLQTVDTSLVNVSGSANYAMSLGGTYDRPKIAASGTVTNGAFTNISFNTLDFHLTDTLATDGKLYDPQAHRIVFSDLSIQSDGEYRLQTKGNFPLKPDVPLDMDIHFSGDLLAFLPKLVPFFEGGTSIADMRLKLGGTRSRLVVKSGYCQIERGELWLKSVAPHIENIHGFIDLKEGTNQVNIHNLKASADGREVTFNTVRHITTSTGRKLKPWYFNTFNLDFGILSIKTGKNGVKLHLPGLMKKEDEGYFAFSGKSANEPFYFAGPIKHPVAYGTITVQNARVTYPFIRLKSASRKPSIAVEFLSNLDWDVLVKPGEATIYEREIPAYIDNVNTELYADVSSPGLAFSGIINNGTFRALGKLTSSRGRLEYLDQNFKLDIFTIEFTQWDTYPLVSGRAWTTIRDSVGAVPKTIYLKLYAVDPETNSEKQQGSLENFRFKLESADPQIGEDQEQVLSYMGFSVSNLKEKATSVGGSLTERILIRPLLRPIERALENTLGLDMVRINSRIAKNLFYSSLGYGSEQNMFFNPFVSNSSYLFLMQSSEITVGKYLSKDLYLTYTGQLVSVYNQSTPELDVNHSIGLEYRFFRNVLLEFEYDRELMRYYRFSSQKQYLNDFKIRLRHSFTF